jgi:glycerol-3-phosphate dehydrogenase (NAD(P)+)
LPGIAIPAGVKLEADLDRAVTGAEVLVMAVPTKAIRETGRRVKTFSGVVVSVAKGVEHNSGLTMSQILQAEIPKGRVAVLSGPTFAPEVARRMPSAAVAASEDAQAAQVTQEIFHQPYFRIYTNQDTRGVELGGALKNVIAIAAGVCDGLGFGDNSKAALVTRAIAEIRRLGVACGAKAETFAGLSGLGDLTVTCFSRQSRNRAFGERIGKGERVTDILPTLSSVAEGYPTARSAAQLAQRAGVDAPIIAEVYAMLYEMKEPADALRDLTSRDSKSED